MNWYRRYVGTCADPKFSVVAKKSGMHKTMVLAVWESILECASTATPRGRLTGFDFDDVAAALDMEPEDVQRIFKALVERGLITETPCNGNETFHHVSKWQDRQYESDNSYSRVKKHREKKRTEQKTETAETSHKQNDETFQKQQGNVTKRPQIQNRTDSDTDSEQNKHQHHTQLTDQNTPLPPHGESGTLRGNHTGRTSASLAEPKRQETASPDSRTLETLAEARPPETASRQSENKNQALAQAPCADDFDPKAALAVLTRGVVKKMDGGGVGVLGAGAASNGFNIADHLTDRQRESAALLCRPYSLNRIMEAYNRGTERRGIPAHPALAFEVWLPEYLNGIHRNTSSKGRRSA